MSSKSDEFSFERTISIIREARRGNAEALARLTAAFERQGFVEDEPTFWKTPPLREPAKKLHYVAIKPNLAHQDVFWAEIFFHTCHLINNELKLNLCWAAFSLDETSSSGSAGSSFGLEHSIILYTSARQPRRAFRYSLTKAYVNTWLKTLSDAKNKSDKRLPRQQGIGLCVTKSFISENSNQLRFISVQDNRLFSHWRSNKNKEEELLASATRELKDLAGRRAKNLWNTYIREYRHLVSPRTTIRCHISSTSLFHSLEDESARAGAQLIVGLTKEPSFAQAKLIHTFFQIMLSGLPALYSSLRRLNREAITLKRYRQQLNLLQAPLSAITDSLTGMQSNTQRLRAALYEPSHALFDSHSAISELFDENRALHASTRVVIHINHNNRYQVTSRRKNRDSLPPEKRKGTIKDGRVVFAVALLRIFGQSESIKNCQSRTAIIKTARQHLLQCEGDPAFAGLIGDLRWLFKMKDDTRFSNVLAGDVSGYLSAIKAVLFDPFKLETKRWDKRALILATRPYQVKQLGNPGRETVHFSDGISPVSFHTVLAFVADAAAAFAQTEAKVVEIGLVSKSADIAITVHFDKANITQIDGLHGMRRLVNHFILTQPRDWRTTDSATGNFRKPFVDIASRMLGVENKSSAWRPVPVRALSSTGEFWDVFAVRWRDRLFRIRFSGEKRKGHDRLVLEWLQSSGLTSKSKKQRKRH